MARRSLLRAFVALAVAVAAGTFAFAAGAGLASSWRVGVGTGALVALVVGWWLWSRPIIAIDSMSSSRPLEILSALATIGALVELIRVAIFMVAPTRVDCSFLPSSEWEVHHSCVSAYYVAAQAAGERPNVYDSSLYSVVNADPRAIRKPRMMGPFRIDMFEYPPPFLLVPRALRLAMPEFVPFRAFWFALTGGVVLLAMLMVARALGPKVGTRALLLAPLVWAALPTLSALQKGNVQLLVIALSLIAMLLFERKQFAGGGALMAYATISKLFPGLLLVYLIARREWRAVAWTAVFGVLFVLVTLADIGWHPYDAFLRHFPGLLSGEAFPALRNPAAAAINFSVPGLVFKANLFGSSGLSFGVAKVVGWAYTLVAVALAIVAGRRGANGPIIWLAIIILATLRSPFLPQAYAAFPPLWLLTLLAARHAPVARTLALTLATWLALNVFWPLDWAIDPRLLATVNLVPQAVTVILAALALRGYRVTRSAAVPG